MKYLLIVALLFTNSIGYCDDKLDLLIQQLESALKLAKELKEPVPEPEKELKLTYLGVIRLPPHLKHPSFNTDLYARGRQQLAPVHGTTNELWATYADEARGITRYVGKLKLPNAEFVLTPSTTSPRADWLITPVLVGQHFRDQVVAALGGQSNWAWLTGVADDGEKVWLNYGQYYHVQPGNYDNLSTIDRTLDVTTEVFLKRSPDEKLTTKQTAGWIVHGPPWLNGTLFRGDYWLNGSNGGPNSSYILTSNPLILSTPVTQYSTTNKVDETWSNTDDWITLQFFQSPTGKRYRGFIVRKGTAPGWYGDDTPPSDNTTNTKDVCSAAKGYHAHPYFAELWLFREEDVIESIRPKPYRKITLNEFGGCAKVVGGAILGDVLYLVHDQAYKVKSTDYEAQNVLKAYKLIWE